MKEESIEEKAARFITEYHKLKEKKGLEKFLAIIKSVILSSKQDNITDKEIIDLIRSLGFKEKLYPSKFNELRKQLLNSDKASDFGDEHGSNKEDGEESVSEAKTKTEPSGSVAPSLVSDALSAVAYQHAAQ